jgi:hypothetical protein
MLQLFSKMAIMRGIVKILIIIMLLPLLGVCVLVNQLIKIINQQKQKTK